MKQTEILKKLNTMSNADLHAELEKSYTETRRDRLNIEAKKSQNTAAVKKQRIYIAQILTVLNSRVEE